MWTYVYVSVYLCTFVCVYICVSYALRHILKYKWTSFYFSRCHVNCSSRDEQTSTHPHQVSTDKRDYSTQVQLGEPMVWLWIIIGTRVKVTYRRMDNLWVVTLQKKHLPLPRAMIYPRPCWQHGLVKPLILPCEPPSPAGENVTGSSLAKDVGSHDTDLEGNSSPHPKDRVLHQIVRNKAALYQHSPILKALTGRKVKCFP